MTEESSPVYFRLGDSESNESKKNLLSLEISLLSLIKIIRRYNALRVEELKLKSDIEKAMGTFGNLIKKSQASFPFFKIPKKEKKEEISKKLEDIDENIDKDLEFQLREIQEKLKLIQG